MFQEVLLEALCPQWAVGCRSGKIRKGFRKTAAAHSAASHHGLPGNAAMDGAAGYIRESGAGHYRYFVTPWNSRIRFLISRGRASEASSMQ